MALAKSRSQAVYVNRIIFMLFVASFFWIQLLAYPYGSIHKGQREERCIIIALSTEKESAGNS